jgi:hypothetical protein
LSQRIVLLKPTAKGDSKLTFDDALGVANHQGDLPERGLDVEVELVCGVNNIYPSLW